MNNHATLLKIIRAFGSQKALAAALSTTERPLQRGAVAQWVRRERIPVEWVIPIEKLMRGQVTRHEMRPDIYPIERVA